MRFLECIVAANQASKSPFLTQMHQQCPDPGAWSEVEFALQRGSIHRGGRMEQRVLRVAPALQPAALTGWVELKGQCG